MTTRLDEIKYEALVSSCESNAATAKAVLDVASEFESEADVNKLETEYDNACIKLFAAQVLLANYTLSCASESDDIYDGVDVFFKACLTLIQQYSLIKEIQRHSLDRDIVITIILGDDAVTFTISNERLDISSAAPFVTISKVFS